MTTITFAGKTPRALSTFIAPGSFLVGDVVLKEGSSVWFGAIIRGDTALCEIGRGTVVLEQCYVENTIVGDNTMLSHGAIAHKCKIGNQVLVGIGARIINGAKIGDNCLIGAGALITPNTKIPPNSVVIDKGKIVRAITEKDILYIRQSVEEVQQKALQFGQQYPPANGR
jgi:carbonic anhydrase/acetyltransferase-like protein (isoleucine patch superfamily)